MARSMRVSKFPDLRRGSREIGDALAQSIREAMLQLVRAAGYHPAVESFVEDEELVIRADLPGLDPEHLEASVRGDLLMIKAERKGNRNRGRREGAYLHREIAYGSLEREIRLPAGAQTAAIEASYANGVLEIKMPIFEEERQPVSVRSETARQPVKVRSPRKARTTVA